MLKNNNDKIITKMAGRSFTSNRRKNLIMVLAIALSVFMIFTIMTVGGTYFKMHSMQEIRMNGADFDAVLMGGYTKEQRSICESNPDIDVIGVEARAGYSEKTDEDDTLHSILVWSDETHWKVQKKPAVTQVKGKYPTKENEVMVTKEVLEDCGKEGLSIGDTFTLTYSDFLGSHTKEFSISGMWEGHGDKKVFYVSKAFYDQSGYKPEDTMSGIMYLNFKSPILSEKDQLKINDSLPLGKQQHLSFSIGTEMSVQILLGMIGLILMTCLSAYLLIYNILYLSVSGNIRYYGLLQTVGMTGRQIYKLIQRQMLIVGMVGTAIGLLFGTVISFGIIPRIVKILGIRNADIEVVFHPAIFLLSIVIAGLTVYIGGRKPARIATDISPIEALGYRTLSGRKKSHKTGKHSLLWRMAKEQFLKDKKKSGIVVLSLAASLSIFLCLVTLIESHGARTVISNYMDMDMIITNDTLKKENMEEWEQIIDGQFLGDLKDNKSVKEAHTMTTTPILIPWEPDFADMWMREFYATWMTEKYEDDIETYKQQPEKYYTFMMGIDEGEFDYLNASLEKPIDKEEFMKGNTCVIYQDRLELSVGDVKGKTVSYSLFDDRNKTHNLKIAGMTNDGHYIASGTGMTPAIIVSNSLVKRMVDTPYTSRVSILYDTEYDTQLENQIKGYMDKSQYASDFSYDSKIDSMKTMKKAQGNMMGVGAGIALILALIGIMNYVNTVSGNMQNRQVELSVMESLGMAEKQIRKMLIWEGFLYAGVSIVLTGTIGLVVTYICYQYVNYQGIPFEIPLLPVGIVALLVVLICVTIPLIAYRIMMGKRSIVERIRGFE